MPIMLEPGKLNNKVDPIKLGVIDFRDPAITALTSAVNIDLDNNSTVSRRTGRTQRYAGSTHSFWVHPKNNQLAYFVEDGVLKKLATDYTAATVATLSTDLPLRYEVVNDQVVASNAVDIGWLGEDEFDGFAASLGQFEVAMPAGQYLGFYKGTLYVANGTIVTASKPHNIERRDERYSMFPMNGYIRMLAAVEDGLWVATDQRVAFVQGGGPDEFTYTDVTDNIPPDGGFSVGWEEEGEGVRRVVRWVSKEGFCTGRAGGAYESLSFGDVALPPGASGHCFRRDNNGIKQYVAVIREPGEDDSFVPPVLAINAIVVSANGVLSSSFNLFTVTATG